MSMTTRVHPSATLQWLRAGVLVLVLVATGLVSHPAAANHSHFRYGHISYVAATGNTIDFTVASVWRRNAYPSCYDPATNSTVSCSGPDSLAAPGDVIRETAGGTQFLPGDGTAIGGGVSGSALLYLVTSVNVDANWLFGLALDPDSLPSVDTSISHTYASAGPVTAAIDSCCRFNHVNNSNDGYRVEALVDVGSGNRSPVSNVSPIVNCVKDAVCEFTVPASDPDDDALSFRFSTPTEAGDSSFTQPGPPHAPSAATIDAVTGVYSWDTTGAIVASSGPTFYSTQVTIEERDAAGTLTGKVAVDFLIQLVDRVGAPPVFDSPPTPICGTTLTVNTGDTLAFTVQASDPDAGDLVTLTASGLPSGAAMSPPLPASGNPVASDFSWTPTAAQLGDYVVTFQAEDQAAQQALCSLTLRVEDQPPDSDPPPPDDTAPSCELTAKGKTADGRTFIEVTVQDGGSGLASIVVAEAVNADVVVEPFAAGTTDPVTVTATKINQSASARVTLEATDVAGNVTVCDPVHTIVVRDRGRPVPQTLSGIPAAEDTVTVTNGTPGLRALRIEVNGTAFRVNGLGDAEEVSIDISAALQAGSDNVITLTAYGRPGSSAEVMIWEG